MDKQVYLSLLNKVENIYRHHNEISGISGDNFNLFRIINLTTEEVRIHSAFITELLDPQGSHGQGTVFLKLFTEYLGLTDIDVNTCDTKAEKSIGNISEDGTQGGQIDVFISDRKGNCIAIENKINAGDQDNQLVRYKNYCCTEQWKNHTLIYLTLEGRRAAQESCGKMKAGDDYIVVSYKSDIIEWLELCRKEAVTLPILREGITHYINLLKHLTNQTGSGKMHNEIAEAIIASPETFRAAHSLAVNVDNGRKLIQWKFWELLREKLERKGYNIKDPLQHDQTATPDLVHRFYFATRNKPCPGLWIEIYKKDNISIHWGAEIEHNFYTGFTIEKNGIGGISNEPDYAVYRKLVGEIDHAFVKDNDHWLGWKHSDPILNFRHFNDDVMYGLADKDNMDNIVSAIAQQGFNDIESLKAKLSTL